MRLLSPPGQDAATQKHGDQVHPIQRVAATANTIATGKLPALEYRAQAR